MKVPAPSDWLDALEAQFESLATNSLGFGQIARVGRSESPPATMEGAYLALLTDAGPIQLGLASIPDGCRALANGLMSLDSQAPMAPADVADAVCEIVNMLSGCVQRHLRSEFGLESKIGLPTFFHGPVQPTERLHVAVAELSLGGMPAALLVIHPRTFRVEES